MASENEEKMIVGLDIGTSKIVAIVGSVGPGELELWVPVSTLIRPKEGRGG